MAVGDIIAFTDSIAASGTLSVQPAGTEEWIIWAIYLDNAASSGFDLKFTDGTDAVIFAKTVTADNLVQGPFHLTALRWINITNLDGGNARTAGYSGVVSHA